eukprot:GHVU01034684.1.p1 GENE.GHVU01034684.1~~GHVU01034684.1.p1  ORF type:complete len:326 (+),score=39.46 GHVU01034684.1:256-1233(+)
MLPTKVISLLKRPFKDLDKLPPQELCVLGPDATVEDFIGVSVKNHLRGALVRGESQKEDDIAVIDIRDVIHAFVAEVEKAKTENASFSAADVLPGIRKRKAKLLCNIAGKSSWVRKDDTDTLGDISTSLEGCPRVLIFSEDKLCRVFTITDLLYMFFAYNCFSEASDVERSYEVLSKRPSATLTMHTPVTVAEDSNIYEAIRLMDSTGYSALPIMSGSDADQKPIGIVSLRDTIMLIHGEFISGNYLKETVMDYVSAVRQSKATMKTQFPYINVHEEASMLSVILRLVSARIHRVVVLGPEGQLKAVVSVSDISRFVSNEIKKVE